MKSIREFRDASMIGVAVETLSMKQRSASATRDSPAGTVKHDTVLVWLPQSRLSALLRTATDKLGSMFEHYGPRTKNIIARASRIWMKSHPRFQQTNLMTTESRSAVLTSWRCSVIVMYRNANRRCERGFQLIG
ncbi:hypothetical protein IF1G_03157 [Cordyceps javanica]|uniref:Uncharacterized protein n=1 Tax=Cordyceps javanica TaxID=43265 RepID=A0A545V6T7_9HYPO|nr:hypothetical protein IF1G_03157 [Cordyceps javanica]